MALCPCFSAQLGTKPDPAKLAATPTRAGYSCHSRKENASCPIKSRAFKAKSTCMSILWSGQMKILWLLHTYWHTSVPLRKVSHLPPLRQDSASCVHRKPANRRKVLATAQVPGGSGGAASPSVSRTRDKLAQTPGAAWGAAAPGGPHPQGDGGEPGPCGSSTERLT